MASRVPSKLSKWSVVTRASLGHFQTGVLPAADDALRLVAALARQVAGIKPCLVHRFAPGMRHRPEIRWIVETAHGQVHVPLAVGPGKTERGAAVRAERAPREDRKSTRLNSSH